MSLLFAKIQEQLDKNLPIVAYKKPQLDRVKLVFQDSDEIYEAADFSESGFVFAPFDSARASIVIPFQKILEMQYERQPIICKSKTESISTVDNTHVALVEKGINAIREGEFDKVVLSRMVVVEQPIVEPIILFERLLNAYPDAFVYLWYHPKVGLWLGATPEQLLEMNGLKGKTVSLAGTQLYAEQISWEEKEREEQLYVTKYIREKLANHTDSYSESDPFTTKAGNLAHLKTNISFRMKRESTLGDLISDLHPTPAVCGMPKENSKRFILNNEGYDRAFYTGFLGELNLENERKNNRRNTENKVFNTSRRTSELYVNLRCMQIVDNKAYIYVGGGITKASHPQKELQETVNKSMTMSQIL